MTRSDQRIMARAHIHIPDEDVTELAPDDLKRIEELERTVKHRNRVIFAFACIIAFETGWLLSR